MLSGSVNWLMVFVDLTEVDPRSEADHSLALGLAFSGSYHGLGF